MKSILTLLLLLTVSLVSTCQLSLEKINTEDSTYLKWTENIPFEYKIAMFKQDNAFEYYYEIYNTVLPKYRNLVFQYETLLDIKQDTEEKRLEQVKNYVTLYESNEEELKVKDDIIKNSSEIIAKQNKKIKRLKPVATIGTTVIAVELIAVGTYLYIKTL